MPPPSSRPSRAASGPGPFNPIRWGWLAVVAGAHAAGLAALSGLMDGASRSGPPAERPAVITVLLVTPPSPAPPATSRPIAPARETIPARQAPARPAARPAPDRVAERQAAPPASPAAPAPAVTVPPVTPATPTQEERSPLQPLPPAPAPARPHGQAAEGPASAPPADSAPSPVPARFDAAYLRNPPPEYPRLSRRRGEQGRVLLRVRVLASGLPEHIEVARSSGHPRLDEAAGETVAQWRFTPARRGETAVDSWLLVPIEFRLED